MILISHWDPDGILCISLFYKKFGKDIKVYFSGPRLIEKTLIKVIGESNKSEEIFITDIAPTQEAIYLSSYFKKAIWIDHHVWDKLELTSKIEVYRKGYKSAARVVSEFLNIESKYLDFIDDIDSNNIRNQLERDFRDLIAGIKFFYPKSYNVWFLDIAKKLSEEKDIESMIKEYETILLNFRNILEKHEDKIILNTKIEKIDNTEIFFVYCDINIPAFYVVETLQKRIKKDLDYVFILYENKGEIRTTTNKNVLEIAKELDGGGHIYAAGFQYSSEENLIEKIKEIFKRKNIV